MSVIEDSRKVMPRTSLAPELRGISVRLDALEKRLDGVGKRLDGMDRKTDQRFDEVDRRAEKRHEEVLAAIRQIIDWSTVQQRLARLESKGVRRSNERTGSGSGQRCGCFQDAG